jgi:hypothetical protein
MAMWPTLMPCVDSGRYLSIFDQEQPVTSEIPDHNTQARTSNGHESKADRYAIGAQNTAEQR